MTMLGKPVDRIEGGPKTRGTARYSTEYPVDDPAYAAVVHATIPHGRIISIETGAAEATDGVIRVLTHLNAPRLRPPARSTYLNPPSVVPGTTVNYLNTDEVHFDGQPVGLVIANSIEAAHEAAERVEVIYAELPAAVDFSAEQVHARDVKGSLLASALGIVLRGRRGDAEAALARADVVVDEVYTTPAHNHNALEPHSTTAVWEGDQLTVYDGTQIIDFFRRHLARTFSIPTENVRLISPSVGGAFGGKAYIWAGTVLAALAARVTGRSVRLMLTRKGVYRIVGGRTATTQRVAFGADRSGRMTSLIHEATTRHGTVGGTDEQVTSAARNLYSAENILHRQRVTKLNLVPNTIMRGPGESVGVFALESAVDDLAHRLGIDPVRLRLANRPSRNPVDHTAFSHRRLEECLRTGADLFGWAKRDPAPRSMRDGDHYVGWGVAAAVHAAVRLDASLTLSLSARGGVTLRCAFEDSGVGSATATRQLVSHLLGLREEHITVEYGDSSLPVGPPAIGSSQTASIAGSLVVASSKLLDAVHKLAGGISGGSLRGTDRTRVEARDEGIFVDGAGETYADILRQAGRDQLTVHVGATTKIGALFRQAGLLSRLLRDSFSLTRIASGAHFCEVRVDSVTGEVRVSRWLGVFDIGRVINRKTASSQLRGGVVMGLGAALTEATLIDPRNGRIMNPNISDYQVPVHADVPPIDVHTLDDPDPTMPLGVLGAGEIGTIGVAAAVVNAVHHATGKRIRDLPITLDKLLG